MGPYMKELYRLLGYKSIKAKFSCVGNIEEIIEDDEENENNLRTIYKSPIVEKDEIILELRKEKEKLIQEKEALGKELPILQESLTKSQSKLNAI